MSLELIRQENISLIKKAESQRREKNQEIVRKLKRGDYIPPKVNMKEIWYPIRPKIKKDAELIKRLYGEAKQ